MKMIAASHSNHLGKKYVLGSDDDFQLYHRYGPHECVAHRPLGITLAMLHIAYKSRIPINLCKNIIRKLLLGLDFLHTDLHIVHADLSLKNVLSEIRDAKQVNALVRKALITTKSLISTHQRSGHSGIAMVESQRLGRADPQFIPVLGGFGRSRFGRPEYNGHIMEEALRPPECHLGAPFTYKADMWGIGMMAWELVVGCSMLNLPRRGLGARHHYMAQLVSAIGTPPPAFLRKCDKVQRAPYFGGPNMLPMAPVLDLVKEGDLSTLAKSQGMDKKERRMEPDDEVRFFEFIACLIAWDPADRSSAMQAVMHPWLQQDVVEIPDVFNDNDEEEFAKAFGIC